MIPEISPGTLINNRYQINKILGQGGFGRTYLAFDNQRFNEPCVLKEFVPATQQKSIISKSRELFEREAKVLYQIKHEQIPQFLAWLTEDERVFIVQEFINGKTYAQILSERIQATGKAFSEAEIREWLLYLLPVLEYIHSRNIIHRDISLENIMLPENQSKPILIDFGVVKEKVTQILSADSPQGKFSLQGSVVGKIGYSPPEQLRFGQCYPSSDLYALAVSALVLLTGKLPSRLVDKSMAWRWRPYVKISNAFAQILEKMLADLPNERYQSATDVIAELNCTSQVTFGSAVAPSETPKFSLNKISFNLFSKQGKKETTAEQTQIETSTIQQWQSRVSDSLSLEFLDYCQRQLASSVGPFATVLIKQTIDKNPGITPEGLVEKLVAKIPDAERSRNFQEKMKTSVDTFLKNQQQTEIQLSFNKAPAISNPEFLERCRRELNSFIGPFGSVMIKDTLDHNPNLTPKELVDTLVAEIPNPQRAQEFRQRVDKLL